ncbi:GFA family protein [Pelagibacterium xiamenense]|uniref:GFA family protein n=1 Tax=Pelagibacterium xiamenense TaxID=2901140 RepID=UPI0021075201|nr:GFA family protein [Pelagibacterium xiamenense]
MTVHRGSCHCGAVTFSARIDLTRETSRCNCSSCRKSRFWKAVIPAGDFTLETGADMLADYTFGGHIIHHRFCTRCGVKPFGSFTMAELGGPMIAVNVACLDDVSPQALDDVPVVYEDGQHDTWERVPAYTGHL